MNSSLPEISIFSMPPQALLNIRRGVIVCRSPRELRQDERENLEEQARNTTVLTWTALSAGHQRRNGRVLRRGTELLSGPNWWTARPTIPPCSHCRPMSIWCKYTVI